jgi:hypothetical protein
MTGPALAALAFAADAAVVAAAHSWPAPISSAAVYGMLAFAWVLSLAAYFTLRSHGGSDDGPPEMPPDPDPPWWPEFERDFHDYARRGPRPTVRPRQPVA